MFINKYFYFADEALVILKKGAQINGRTLPPDDELREMLSNIYEEDKEEKEAEVVEQSNKDKVYETFKELIILVETPEMRKRTLNIFYSWLVVAMVYYGLSFNTKNLGGNRYINSFISGFVEVSKIKVYKNIFPFMNNTNLRRFSGSRRSSDPTRTK